MTKSEVKRRLNSANEAFLRIKKLQETILKIRQSYEHMTPSYSGMPGSGSPDDKFSMMAARIDELEREQQEELIAYDEALKEVKRIVRLLETVNPKYAEVIRFRYAVPEADWEWVAKTMRYEIRQVYRFYNKALKVLCKLL